MHDRFSRLTRPTAALFALAIAACTGDGCGCMGTTPGGFPSAERVDNAVQLRVTSSGLAAVEADPASLVDSLLGTENGEFEVPAQCGGNPEICCDNGGNPIDPCGPVDIDLEPQAGDAARLEINPGADNGHIQVIARARIRTLNDIRIKATEFGVTATCNVAIDTTATGNESMTLTLDVDLAVGGETKTTELRNIDATVSNIDDDDVTIKDGTGCGFIDTFLKGVVIDQITGTLEDLIAGTLADFTCKSCPSGDVADCGEFADACSDEVCMRGSECLQELGLAGRLLAEQALGGFSRGQLGGIDLYEVAGGYAETSGGGVSLGMLGGMLPAGTDRDRCGPPGIKPDAIAVPRSDFFSGNARPDTGTPFGVGIGVHQHTLDQFAWSAYESGFLCITSGVGVIDLLNSDTFAILMPSLGELTHGEIAPMSIGLRPQSQPVFTLGAGTSTAGGAIDDPLITVELPGLEIDFFALIDYQWIRVMTMRSDVSLPVNIDVDPDGALAPVLGDIDEAFANITVSNSEPLRETPEELAARLPVLLDLAISLLADSLTFDLPALGALRLSVQPDGITSVEAESVLAIFADLSVDSARTRVETHAALAKLETPERRAFAAPELYPDAGPVATLALDGDGGGAPLEWSVRVDGSMWSPYSRDRQRLISSRHLWLQGRHRVEVRARVVGEPLTADLTPAVVEIPIDTAGPRLRFRHLGVADQLWVNAEDYVDRDAIDLEVKLPGGEWQAAGAATPGVPVAIDLGGASAADVWVRARDARGNETEGNPVLRFHGAGDGGCGGCQSSGAGGGGLLLALLAAIALGGRRRLLPGLALLAILVLTPACSCGEAKCAGGECQPGEVERGPTGRWLSSAADGDRVVIAAYEEGLGDLVLVDIDDAGELSIRAVDGIPDNQPVHDPGTYRGGIREPGIDVGAWTSVALADGRAWVSYQDRDSGQLKLGREDGDRFATHVVDAAEGGEIAGQFTSLAFTGGVPTIAYQAIGVPGDGGVRLAQLRLARAQSESPASASDWSIEVVDEVAISCAGLCGDDSCIAAEGVEICAAPTSDCSEPCGEDTLCYQGACTAVIAPPASTDLPLGTGLFAKQVSLADGRAAIIYYRRHSGDLVAAVDDGGGWTLVELDSRGDVGAFATAAADQDGLIHVAYQDAIGDQLLHLTFDGAAASAPEVVDDGVREGEERSHPVGAGASIAVQGSEVVIAYQDGLTSDLLAARGGSGGWSRVVVRDGPSVDGFYNAIAIGAGAAWLITYQYDRSLGGLPGGIVLSPLD